MKITALLFDIDGSIMPQGGPIEPEIANLFRQLNQIGFKMGPATGKNADYCRGLACGIGINWDFISAETGAQFLALTSKNPPVYQQRKLNGAGHELALFLKSIEHDQFSGTFRNHKDHQFFRPEPKVGMISMFPPNSNTGISEAWVPFFKEKIIAQNLSLQVLRHSDGCVDIIPQHVSKTLGIQNICLLLGIAPANILTVVDGANDYELTQGGVKTIAVANASAEIKKAVHENGGYLAPKNHGQGFKHGLRFYAEMNYFEPDVRDLILSNISNA